jgi:uncharacterized protein (TIGR02421 family)
VDDSQQALYRATVRELSDRVVAAQRPIRILDAVRWDEGVREAFRAAGGREPPRVDRETYLRRPLGFDPAEARRTFDAIDRDVVARLGTMNPAGRVLRRMCREYETVLAMLGARGTPDFAPLARELYGASTDVFHAGGPSLLDLAELLDGALRAIDAHVFDEDDVADIPTERAVALLQERLDRVFSDPDSRVRVREADGIVADAAAGADSIKLRKGALFSPRDLRVLEVHEGWVHVGTSLNGRAQPVCSFLGKGTPSTTLTQEGLALLIEVLAFASHPVRLRRVIDRTRAIAWAEHGAGFLDVYRRLQEEGRAEEDAWATSVRVFRGSLPDAGPFPKDLAYAKGFVQVYNFLRLAVRRGRLDRIPLLFCGKIALDEVGTLADLLEEGLVASPRHLPPPIEDLRALSAWMAWSNLLNRLDLSRLEADFAPLLS